MKNPFLAQMQKETWVMELRALDTFLRRIAEAGKDPLKTADNLISLNETAIKDEAQTSRMRIQNGVAIIPITGYLLKEVPKWFAWFGIDATSYSEIRDNIKAALKKDSVKSIMLKVDSPGGMVAGVQETADAIFAARKEKPVGAFIEDLGASGAYWLASQAQSVTTNKNAEVGSIGVYTVYDDFSAYFEKAGIKTIVIRSGEHKGMGVIGAPISDEQIKAVQEVIDGIADNFISSVARGRSAMKKSEVITLATGRVWLAAEAKELGLVDRIESYESALIPQVRNQAASLKKKGDVMAEGEIVEVDKETVAVDLEAVKKEAESKGSEIERNRLIELRAAFPENPDFAFEQFEKGASVTDAKVAYVEVLRKQNEELQKKVQKAAEISGAGADPISGSSSIEPGPIEEDFMSVSRALGEEKQISLTEAMRRTAREHPELHQAFLEKAREKKVKV